MESLGVVLGAEGLQLVHMTDLDAVDLLAHLVLGHIKGGDQLVAVGVGGDEAAHCGYAVLEDLPLDSARTSPSVFKNSR